MPARSVWVCSGEHEYRANKAVCRTTIGVCSRLAHRSIARLSRASWIRHLGTRAGEITSIDDPGGIVGNLSIESPFSATYTFDPDSPDTLSSNPWIAWYRGAVVDFGGQVGDIDFLGLGSDNYIQVIDDLPVKPFLDQYVVRINELAIAGVELIGFLDVWFTDNSGTMFTSDLLPVDPFDLGGLDFARFEIRVPFEDLYIRGTVTSLTPEPSTLALLLVGALFVTRRSHA